MPWRSFEIKWIKIIISFYSTAVSLVWLDSYPWTEHRTISKLYILVEVSFCIRERASIMLLIPFQLEYICIIKITKNNDKHLPELLVFDKAYMWLIVEAYLRSFLLTPTCYTESDINFHFIFIFPKVTRLNINKYVKLTTKQSFCHWTISLCTCIVLGIKTNDVQKQLAWNVACRCSVIQKKRDMMHTSILSSPLIVFISLLMIFPIRKFSKMYLRWMEKLLTIDL